MLHEFVYVFFTFCDVDRLSGRNRSFHFWQPVEDARHVLEIPNPCTGFGGIGAALPEIFRLITDSLENEGALFIQIIVRDHEAPFGFRLGVRQKQIFHRQIKQIDDALNGASRVALY